LFFKVVPVTLITLTRVTQIRIDLIPIKITFWHSLQLSEWKQKSIKSIKQVKNHIRYF